VAFEYSLWAVTPEWDGENDVAGLADFVVGWPVIKAMADSPTPPPYTGSVEKRFDNPLTRFFLGFDNRLLSPHEAEETGRWLRDWALLMAASPDDLRNAQACAGWLSRAAAAGWYVDWSD
jgi:hypothetical protein